MPEHVRSPKTCDKHCNGCNSCELFHCSVCNGAEGSLPTECPGRKMIEREEAAVYAGDIDYKNGQWINIIQNT